MDLEAHAKELYALALDDFVAARNTAAREARTAGDRELSAALRALPKPSTAAWLVNVLVARRHDEVEQVLDLGASLKDAQAGFDRAQLQALGRQRQRLIAAVARESLVAAAEAGHDVGPAALPGVEQTLRAALADAGAAAAVLSGRLVRTLEASGWDSVDLAGAVGGPFTAPEDTEEIEDVGSPDENASERSASDTRTTARTARRRKQAEAALAAARESRETAERDAVATRKRAAEVEQERDAVAAPIADLERQLDELRTSLAALEQELSELERLAEEADDDLREAREDEDAAQQNVDGLDDGRSADRDLP